MKWKVLILAFLVFFSGSVAGQFCRWTPTYWECNGTGSYVRVTQVGIIENVTEHQDDSGNWWLVWRYYDGSRYSYWSNSVSGNPLTMRRLTQAGPVGARYENTRLYDVWFVWRYWDTINYGIYSNSLDGSRGLELVTQFGASPGPENNTYRQTPTGGYRITWRWTFSPGSDYAYYENCINNPSIGPLQVSEMAIPGRIVQNFSHYSTYAEWQYFNGLQWFNRSKVLNTCQPCTPQAYSQCFNNDRYWYDACNVRDGIRQDCGSDGWGLWSPNYCSNNDVYHSRDYHDRGCAADACFDNITSTEDELVQDCGVDGPDPWGANYCSLDDIYHSRTVHDRGCAAGACFDNTSTEGELVQDCGVGCTCIAATVTCNCPPAADAGLDQSTPSGVAVAVSGACTDSDGTVSDCDWSLPAGCVFSVAQVKVGLGTASASSSASVSCVGAVGSVFTLDLTATDNDSATDSDSMDVTIVAPPNIAPVADAGPDQSTLSGVPVSLSGACDDSDGTIADCDWGVAPAGCSFDFAQVKAGLGFASATSDVDATCVGVVGATFDFTLTATDDAAATGTDDMTVTISLAPNVAPVADADGPYSGASGTVINLAGTCTDSDGFIASCLWQSDYPLDCVLTQADTSDGTGNSETNNGSITCNFAVSTDVTVTLTATDDDAATGQDTATVTVTVAAPASSWFKIVSFELDPNPAILGVSDSINAKVTVTNLGSVVENAEVAITAKDLAGNSVLTGTVPMTLPVGAAEVEFDFIFSVATWEASNYAVTATASAVGAPQPDSKKTVYLAVLEELTVPVPELSVLLLPLLIAVVLFVLRKK